MKKAVKNVAASVRCPSSGTLAFHQTGSFNSCAFDRWAAERFLFRLSRSPWRERFVLKGATLFLHLARRPAAADARYRPPGLWLPNIDGVARLDETQICAVEAGDGILFSGEEITATAIREGAEYDGIRVKIPAILDNAKTTLQIDIGFRTMIDPAAEDRGTARDSASGCAQAQSLSSGGGHRRKVSSDGEPRPGQQPHERLL